MIYFHSHRSMTNWKIGIEIKTVHLPAKLSDCCPFAMEAIHDEVSILSPEYAPDFTRLKVATITINNRIISVNIELVNALHLRNVVVRNVDLSSGDNNAPVMYFNTAIDL